MTVVTSYCKTLYSIRSLKTTSQYLYIIIHKVSSWPAGDWSKRPVNRQRHIRGRRLNDDVRLITVYSLLDYCTSVAVSATVNWYFGNISHKQIIALSLFTRRRRVARSANYPGHGRDARSLQQNAIRRTSCDRSFIGYIEAEPRV